MEALSDLLSNKTHVKNHEPVIAVFKHRLEVQTKVKRSKIGLLFYKSMFVHLLCTWLAFVC